MKTIQKIFLQSAVILFFLISSIPMASAQWKINEGFEGGSIPSGWTVHDANSDGDTWVSFAHSNQNYIYSGSRVAKVECTVSTGGGDDWLITPQVSVASGDVFTFYARSWRETEKMQIRVSTTGTAISNFTGQLAEVVNVGTTYTEYSYSLDSWAGQNVYLAIRWMQDSYCLLVDDVKVGQMQASDQDAGIASIESPVNYQIVDKGVAPAATVKNFGTNPISSAIPVQCVIKNGGGTTVYDQTVNSSGTLAAGATTPVSFPLWTPDVLGIYEVTIKTLVPNDITPSNDALTKNTEVVEHQGVGGPDEQGYRWADSDEEDGPQYNWIDISATGESSIMYGVDAFWGDDNFSEPVPIGFKFPFYGIYFEDLHIDTNGEILFGENPWYIPFSPDEEWWRDGYPLNYGYPIPGFEKVPNLIAVFWDDLEAVEGVSDVYFQTFGSAPNRYFIIQWNNLQFLAGNHGSPTLCFQAILYENGDILMQYKNVANGQSGSNAPHNWGQSATVAIQNGNCDAGLCYLMEQVNGGTYIGYEPKGNLLKNEFAIQFYCGEDHFPPLFAHETIWNTFSTTMEIEAAITDVSGVASDTLYYNFGNGWQQMTHTSFEEPNIYRYLLSDIPKGTEVTYYFAATDDSEFKNRGTFMDDDDYFSFQVLPMANTRILIASPGNVPGFQDYKNTELPVFMKGLDQVGMKYDIYNYNAYTEYEFPEAYDVIFAYANQPNLQDENQKFCLEMINYLDKGTEANPKSLFMASDNLGLVQHPLGNNSPMKKFFQAYLRASYLQQGIPQGGTNGLAGPNVSEYTHGSIIAMGGSPIGVKDQIIEVYADSPDVLVNEVCPEYYADEVQNPEISSWGAYLFHDGPIDGNAFSKGKGAALWLDNLIYKSFFISFDMSQFVHEADVKTMFEEALTWFNAEPEIYTITALAEPAEGGTINPAGEIEIIHGRDLTFTMKPNEDYIIEDVLVDNVSVGAISAYTFEDVRSDHAINVKFKKKDGVDEIDNAYLTIYPNPTSGELKIKSEALRIKSVRVFDIAGRLMQEVDDVDNMEFSLDISNLANGVYFINVDGKTIRVIKQ